MSNVVTSGFHELMQASTALTRANAAGLIVPFEALCQRNGIASIPRILLHGSFAGGMASCEANAILVGAPALKTYAPLAHQGLLAHEMGHLLAGHGGAHYQSARIACEHEADRLAVQLAGTHEPMKAVLTRDDALRETMRAHIDAEPSWRIRIGKRLMAGLETKMMNKIYGTPESRWASMLATDAADRSALDPLIARYNAPHAR